MAAWHPLLGEFPLEALGSKIAEDLSLGLTTIFEPSSADHPGTAGASIMAGLCSGAAIPLIRDGRLRGALVLGRRESHAWSADETALAGEAAARLWEALERARAAAALQDLNVTLENRVAERTLELTSSEAKFRTLFENAPAPIFLISVGPGRQAVYDGVNAAAERFTGRPAQDIVGRAVTQVTSTGEPLLERCMQCVFSGQPVEYEITLEVGGDWRIAECVLAPLPVDGDGRRLLIGIARDITRLRHAEEQLRQAQKMEAIGQLTGGIAHDFNNLLTGIIGSLALMEKRFAQGRTDAIQRYAGLALASANRAAALTHRLLAFSRRQPLEIQVREREFPRHVDGRPPAPHLGREHRVRHDLVERHLADPVRSPPAGKCHSEPGHQRPGRHAGWRPPRDRDQQCGVGSNIHARSSGTSAPANMWWCR